MKGLFSKVIVAFIVLVMNSQSYAQEAGEGLPNSHGFQVFFINKKLAFSLNEPVVVRVVLKNSTQNELTYAEGVAEKDFQLIVKDENGKNLPLTNYGMRLKGVNKVSAMGLGWPATIGGGQEAYYEFVVSRFYDMTKVGTYSIAVKRLFAKTNIGELIESGKQSSIYDEITSEPIEVNITEFTHTRPASQARVGKTSTFSNLQPTVSSFAQWQIGDSWKLAVDWTPDINRMDTPVNGMPEPLTLHYTVNVVVTGETKVDDKPVWQLDFVPDKAFPDALRDQRLRVFVDKADGMTRKTVALGGRKEEREAIRFPQIRLTGSNGVGLPDDILPIPADKLEGSIGVGKKISSSVSITTTTTENDERLVESQFTVLEREPDVVTQLWPEGAKWWSEYTKKSGQELLKARLIPGDRDWGQVVEGVQIAAEVESAVYPGEGVLVHVILKNASDKAVSLNQTLPENDFKIIVKNERGQTMPLMAYGKSVLADATKVKQGIPLLLKAGQEAEYSLLVNRIYDMTQTGTYTVEIKRDIVKMAGAGNFQVEANPLQVRVVENSPAITDLSGGF